MRYGRIPYFDSQMSGHASKTTFCRALVKQEVKHQTADFSTSVHQPRVFKELRWNLMIVLILVIMIMIMVKPDDIGDLRDHD